MLTVAWVEPSGESGFLTLDASLREQHTGNSVITDHPVEFGANVADHIRAEPDMLVVEGIVSNTPLRAPNDHAGGAALESRDIAVEIQSLDNRQKIRGAQRTLGDISPVPLPFISGIPTGLADQADIGRLVEGRRAVATIKTFSEEFNRVGEVKDELRAIRVEGLICSVITELHEYENMALQSYEFPREAAQGDALYVTLTFKQISFGRTKAEPVPKLPTKTKSKGAVTKEETDDGDDGEGGISLARKVVIGK
jgi:hypothetical protein